MSQQPKTLKQKALLDRRKYSPIMSSEVRSLVKKELKIRPEGGEKQIGRYLG